MWMSPARTTAVERTSVDQPNSSVKSDPIKVATGWTSSIAVFRRTDVARDDDMELIIKSMSSILWTSTFLV